MARTLEYNATIVSRDDLGDTLAVFRIRPDGGASPEGSLVPDFIAGQYAVLGANNETDPEKGSVRRAYSIASPPEEKRWLEFYIRLVNNPTSNNPLTPLLWDMQTGSRLWLGPKITGKFTLADTIGVEDPRLKMFVAAGTGLAPFVAILKQFIDSDEIPGIDSLPFVILHGASHPHELGYKEDLELTLNHVAQRYFPTVSRAQQHSDWIGDAGRVETFFNAEKIETLENRLGFSPGYITPENCVVYVCGLQGTISQTLVTLFRRGFIPDDRKMRDALQIESDTVPSIFFEQYDTVPVLDLSNREFLEELRNSFPRSA
jgi:ferredoxin--NADP+ reductase